MQRTLEEIVAWANMWDMDFNVNEFQYQMNDGWIRSVDKERDIGVLMSKGLKLSKQ